MKKRKKRLDIIDKAELAMKKAIKRVIAEHKKAGLPLVVWKDGKVRRIKAE